MKPAACFILLLVSVSAFGQKKVLDTFDLLEGWNVHASDGGVTWTGRDTLPTHDNLAQWILDPSVGIDTDGNFSPRVDKFSRSTNGGQDFSTPVVITGSIVADRTGGVNLTVGPGGEVYATWRA